MPSCDKSMTFTDQTVVIQILTDNRAKINSLL